DEIQVGQSEGQCAHAAGSGLGPIAQLASGSCWLQRRWYAGGASQSSPSSEVSESSIYLSRMSYLKVKVLKPYSWVLRLIMVQLKKCDCSVHHYSCTLLGTEGGDSLTKL